MCVSGLIRVCIPSESFSLGSQVTAMLSRRGDVGEHDAVSVTSPTSGRDISQSHWMQKHAQTYESEMLDWTLPRLKEKGAALAPNPFVHYMSRHRNSIGIQIGESVRLAESILPKLRSQKILSISTG